MVTAAQLEAARRYAPPLVTIGQADRRGARLRSINRQAITYAQRAGLSLEDVYPGGLAHVRAVAPAEDSDVATSFVRAVGLPTADVYPATFAGEASTWHWGWAVAGFALGAVAGGPVWALAGSLLGGFR